MNFFARKPARRAVSNLALAIALASGAAVAAVGIATPAQAQRQPKQEKQEKPKNSKGFIEAYLPLQELTKATAPDESALRSGIESMQSAIENDDDRFSAGVMINTIGTTLQDEMLQYRGLTQMIASGKLPADQLGRFHYSAGQLAYNSDDYPAARESLLQAVAVNYTGADVVPVIADTYFQEENYDAGLAYYKSAIAEREAAGQTPPREWLTRAIANAYNNDKAIPAIDFAAQLAKHHPSKESWRDAINIQRNLVLMEGPELLDLMRLADRAGTIENDRDFLEYADAADVLRAPGEVIRIMEKGIAAGALNRSEPVVAEALAAAKPRIADEMQDLADLEAEAMAPLAAVALVVSSADAYFSNQDFAKAEMMYEVALGREGVDAPLANLRRGMAQLELGRTAEAKESFAKVTGQRRPIALLWTIYADQQSAVDSVASMQE